MQASIRTRLNPRLRTHVIGITDDQPLCQLNMTPLIDVLLVLLIMMILSIPIATHSVKIELPKITGTDEPPVTHILHLGSTGVARWDGEPIGDQQLKSKLEAIARDPSQPMLKMQTDATARYERFDQVIAMVKRAGVQSLGFVGNSKFAKWD